VVADGRARERVVQLGEPAPGGLVEVVRGVEAGERIVVEARGRVTDGAAVALAPAAPAEAR
jgi:multidrug efflux pump subunit AcrA (membrane-fusion protein)